MFIAYQHEKTQLYSERQIDYGACCCPAGACWMFNVEYIEHVRSTVQFDSVVRRLI